MGLRFGVSGMGVGVWHWFFSRVGVSHIGVVQGSGNRAGMGWITRWRKWDGLNYTTRVRPNSRKCRLSA